MSENSMLSKKRERNMIWLYTCFLALLAISICLMPVGSNLKEETMVIIYISGVVFWIGLIGTICIAVMMSNSCKNKHSLDKNFKNYKQLGVIHFHQNTEAYIADIVMFVSIFAFIIAQIWISEIIVSFVLFAIFIFSFGMHCMLNGSNYRSINYNVRGENRDE